MDCIFLVMPNIGGNAEKSSACSGDRGARIGACQTRDNQFSVACRSVAVHRAERAPAGARLQHLFRCAAEISCVRRATATSSQRNEHVRAFTKSRARVHCDLCWRCISLGARAECFPAIAPARPQGRKPGRAQLRRDHDRLWQLRSCRSYGTS